MLRATISPSISESIKPSHRATTVVVDREFTCGKGCPRRADKVGVPVCDRCKTSDYAHRMVGSECVQIRGTWTGALQRGRNPGPNRHYTVLQDLGLCWRPESATLGAPTYVGCHSFLGFRPNHQSFQPNHQNFCSTCGPPTS